MKEDYNDLSKFMYERGYGSVDRDFNIPAGSRYFTPAYALYLNIETWPLIISRSKDGVTSLDPKAIVNNAVMLWVDGYVARYAKNPIEDGWEKFQQTFSDLAFESNGSFIFKKFHKFYKDIKGRVIDDPDKYHDLKKYIIVQTVLGINIWQMLGKFPKHVDEKYLKLDRSVSRAEVLSRLMDVAEYANKCNPDYDYRTSPNRWD